MKQLVKLSQKKNDMIENIRHIGIVVSDIQKSIEFYEKHLGFKVLKRMEEGGFYLDSLLSIKNSKVTTVKLINNYGNIIELLYFHNKKNDKIKKRIYSIGLTHFAINVKNISELYLKLSRKGVEFLSSPQISPDNYAKVAFCKDPDGVYIELVEVLSV